jgi:hypothetical protein
MAAQAVEPMTMLIVRTNFTDLSHHILTGMHLTGNFSASLTQVKRRLVRLSHPDGKPSAPAR